MSSHRGLEKPCSVCGSLFIAVNSTQHLCKNKECTLISKRVRMNAWKLRTGRTKGLQNIWLESDIQFLKDNRFMSSRDIAEVLNRPISSVKGYRSKVKLPELVICEGCGVTFQRANQHNQCIDCVPAQADYNKSHRDTLIAKWCMYRTNAKRRNLEFSLGVDVFATFWKKPCTYCGAEIETIGIDRVDNSIGYIKDNLVPCCSLCNAMKNNQVLGDWVGHLRNIIKYMRVAL